MEPSNFDDVNLYKLVVIGDTNTGKTNIITRYTSNHFDVVSRPTIGVEFFQKDIDIETQSGSKEAVRLQIWDTAGQERFRGMASSYYRKAYGVVLVYDVTSPESFMNCDKWLEEALSYSEPDVLTVLVGNKKDLVEERRVTPNDGQAYSVSNKLLFYETSALNDEGGSIKQLFEEIATRIHNSEKVKQARETQGERVQKGKVLTEINVGDNKSRRCC